MKGLHFFHTKTRVLEVSSGTRGLCLVVVYYDDALDFASDLG